MWILQIQIGVEDEEPRFGRREREVGKKEVEKNKRKGGGKRRERTCSYTNITRSRDAG